MRWMTLLALLVACGQPEPWATEQACRAAADAYCEKRVGCFGGADYELCYGRILSDCKLGLEGYHDDEIVTSCLEAIDNTECWMMDHIPSECTSWWCNGDEGQNYCPESPE